MKKVLFITFFVILFTLNKQNVHASENFSTDYNVSYNVSQNSNTHVVINAALNNLTDKYYASSYSIQVGFKDIKNISANDEEGLIVPKIITGENGSTITLNFNKQVVGLNNKLNFNVNFDTSEIAQNLNNVWDINIPGISSQNDFSSFNVTLNYPSYLGRPTYIKPFISNAYQSPGKLLFSKTDLGGSGISIAFGDFQVYNYSLKYNLENKNLFPISTEIALPPSTNYQDVTIDSINPKPVNVREDGDGNWLAEYHILSSKKVIVSVNGKIKVFLNPKQEALSQTNKKKYLASNQYWNVDSSRIQETANNLKTPYAIYQYVIRTLSYDFSRVETNSPRLGAQEALDKPNSAVCLEFTDLFIALARAAGIPAREIDGYAYTTNSSQRPLSKIKDILHAWPEYYDFDKKTWIMVDPTWGNTTKGIDYFNILDFDHIVFVVKGLNSNYPVPAGGYKISANVNSKDVDVQIAKTFTTSDNSYQTSLDFKPKSISGLPINGLLTITNSGNSITKPISVKITTSYIYPKFQELVINEIPPYGHTELSLSFNKTSFLTNVNDTIKITIGKKQLYKNVVIAPFFVNRDFIIGGLSFVSIFIILSIIAYLSRRIYLQRQKQQDNIRRESSEFKK